MGSAGRMRWQMADRKALTDETPEDVATLYSWANLHGAKYRDFSASRQEQRSQARHRMQEQPSLSEAAGAAAEALAPAVAAEPVPPPLPQTPSMVDYVRMPAKVTHPD